MKKLEAAFYLQPDVLQVSKDLLGKLIVTNWNNEFTSGRIVETEAYAGVTDRASHSFGTRRTARTEVMYSSGGLAYVYLCYGIHHLFNVVTGPLDNPLAVLIRALEPVEGLTYMAKRTGSAAGDSRITAGPGKLTKALGISVQHSGYSLQSRKMFLADDGFRIDKNDIIATPRIGVDYAGDDALLPYRFTIRNHQCISVRIKTNTNSIIV